MWSSSVIFTLTATMINDWRPFLDANKMLPVQISLLHDDVIKCNHIPRYWPFVRGIHRSRCRNSPHKGQWCGALMFSLICAWINDWINNREAGDLRRHRGLYGVNVIAKRRWAAVDHQTGEFKVANICTPPPKKKGGGGGGLPTVYILNVTDMYLHCCVLHHLSLSWRHVRLVKNKFCCGETGNFNLVTGTNYE